MSETAKELADGWTYDPYHGAVYHFRHVPLAEAKDLAGQEGDLYAIDVVNWTLATTLPLAGAPAQRDRQQVHLNTFYTLSLADALALANSITVSSLAGQIAEEVVAVRRAAPQEADLYWLVEEHLTPQPAVLSDADVLRRAAPPATRDT